MPSLEEAREQTLHEDKWTMARRVVSDDHPADCPCIRDHLEVSFIHGMGVAEERIAALVAALEAYEAKQRSIIGNRDGGEMWQHDIDFIEACRREIRALAGQTDGKEVVMPARE